MKTNWPSSILAVVAALFLFTAGCNTKLKETATENTAKTAMTPEQKQKIEKEISDIVKAFFLDVEKLDIEKCMTYFENTPDFQAINPNGTLANFAELKKLNADGFAQLTSLKMIPKHEVIRVLSDSLVLYTYTVGQTGTLKTGQKLSYDNVASTFLFAKINGAWKATFYHESAAAPVVTK